jgi:ferric-dicitrate binding protein FerR (iron transport regulator)
MNRLNVKLTSLLDASGELDQSARRKFLSQITNDPAAAAEFRATHENFTLLGVLPIPEPSALERRLIPAMIKRAIGCALQEKQARWRRMLVRWAGGAMALAACAAICTMLWQARSAQDSRQREEIARIDATIDRVTLLSDQSLTSYDQAVTEVEASIRQLQTESPTLSSLHDKDMGNLLNALAAVPDAIEYDMDDASAPPGSF